MMCVLRVFRIVALLLAISCAALAETEIEGVRDQQTFSFEYRGATDFSGLTWAGGNDWFTVSDKVRAIFPMSIALDPASGKILGASIGTPVPVKTKLADFEGIAFVPGKQRVYVSCETGDGIFGFDLKKRTVIPVAVPPIFSKARNNKSLESLTYDSTIGNFWTANEEALKCDGPMSRSERGTVVRLQRFDGTFRASGQFAYVTEPSTFRTHGGGTGVSDLALLPNGELLVLERVVGTFGLSVKIFRAELRGATDISKVPALEGAEYKPAAKTLLFSRATLTNNFEGIALGPQLADGWRSLILNADSGGGTTHLLIPLRIRWNAKQSP
ncbi:MAG: esterase-like activity of phytase family protein [Verrucomicrobia bacterium]|nr:esterase-like activity of phytase family protein [Verrucomicrobiota bacterium]